MKNQIEHSQRLIERTQVKLQKDFENWWNEQCAILVNSNILYYQINNAFYANRTKKIIKMKVQEVQIYQIKKTILQAIISLQMA
jgi:hypothetical protein